MKDHSRLAVHVGCHMEAPCDCHVGYHAIALHMTVLTEMMTLLLLCRTMPGEWLMDAGQKTDRPAEQIVVEVSAES